MKIKANSFFIPLKNKSVQTIITSPPYWSLRKYDIPDVILDGRTGCEHEFGNLIIRKTSSSYNVGFNERYGNSSGSRKQETSAYGQVEQGCFCLRCGSWTGQFGLEPTVQFYINHLMIFMAECWRVLKSDGICWINIGDTYGGSGGAGGDYNKGGLREGQPKYRQGKTKLKPKSLSLIPERFVIGCQDQGWIIRNVIIWHKSNALPESVQDRFSRRFEYVYMLVKQKKYYFDLDAVREKINIPGPPKNLSKKTTSKWTNIPGQHTHGFMRKGGHQGYYDKDGNLLVNPKGKNPGNVWRIPSQPLKEAHYAAYPEKLIERILLCSTRPSDIVIDPFVGSGTTGKVAIEYGRKFVGLDLGYFDIQKKRTKEIQMHLASLHK